MPLRASGLCQEREDNCPYLMVPGPEPEGPLVSLCWTLWFLTGISLLGAQWTPGCCSLGGLCVVPHSVHTHPLAHLGRLSSCGQMGRWPCPGRAVPW